MASTSTLAIALLLTANTTAASRAISNFANNSSKKMEAINTRATQMISSGTSRIAQGIAIAAPIEMAIKAAAGLEDKIADVAKVANVDFGSKQFHGLEQSAMRVGEYLGRDSTAVGELMAELAAGGVASNRLESIAQSAGKIGVAFDVSAGEAGKAYMMIQNAMGLTEQQTMHVMDAMNAATNKFGGKAAELLNFMAQGGASVARTLKVSGGDIQAFANALQVVGISSSEAATTMERFQQAILMQDKLKGIFNRAGGGTAGLLAILDKANASGNATQWLLDNKVGQYSTKIAQLAMNLNGLKGVRSQLAYLNDNKNVEGSATQEFINRQKTSNEQYEKMKVGVRNAAIALGSNMLPVVNKLMTQLKPVIAMVSTWIGQHPQLVTQLMKGALALATIKLATGGVQIAVGSLMKTYTGFMTPLKWVVGLFTTSSKQGFVLAYRLLQLGGVFSKIGSLVMSFGRGLMIAGRFMLTNPIGLVLTAIGVAAFLVIKYWKPIKAFFINLWSDIKAGFAAGVQFVKNLILNFTIPGLIYKNWDKIKNYFSGLWDWVKNIFNNFLTWLSNTWVGKVAGKIASIGSAIKNALGFGNNPAPRIVAGNSGAGNMLMTGSRIFSPQLIPARSSTAVHNNFAPVINVQGSASHADAQNIKKQVVNALKEHQAQQQRTRFDR